MGSAKSSLFNRPSKPKRNRDARQDGALAGTYHIVNLATQTHAALLDGDEESRVVSVFPNFTDNANRGSEWLITHLSGNQYKIRNVAFQSYASYDPRPLVGEDNVVGRANVAPWTLRLVQKPNIFTIAPSDRRDVFWMSSELVNATPLEFGQTSTAKECRWIIQLAVPQVVSDVRPRTTTALESRSSTQPQTMATLPFDGVEIVAHADPSPNRRDVNAQLEQLLTVSSARYEADARPKCLPGTRLELLKKIQDWASDPQGRPIFWLRGQAGTGKTTISLTVADTLERQGQLGASFIFSRDQADRNELRHVFPTIAEQLCRLSEEFKRHLAGVIEKEKGVTVFQPEVQLERLIVEPLGKCKSFPSSTVIVIDALDECKDDSQSSTLLGALHRQLYRIPALRFFITSRPEAHIAVAFAGDLKSEATFITLHDIETSIVDRDITLFIRTLLSEGAKGYHDLANAGWPADADVVALAKRSAQLFIYVATAIRVIFDSEVDDPQAQLDEILKSSGDASSAIVTLDALYLSILSVASPTRSDNRRRLLQIIGSILMLATPLSVEDLENLLGLPRGRVRRDLRRLHSVLVIPEPDGDNNRILDLSVHEPGICTIRIIHPSFFDFLTTRCTDERFRIQKGIQHAQLATRCLTLMNESLKRNICQLDDQTAIFKDIKDLKERRQRVISPSLSYACKYWSTHLAASNKSDDLLNLLEQFLSHHLLHWFEALAILAGGYLHRLDNEGRRILRIVMSLVQVDNSERERRILQLLEGATILLSGNCNAISTSVIHIYVAIPGLLDPSSLLRQTYESEPGEVAQAPSISFNKFALVAQGVGLPQCLTSKSLDGTYLAALDQNGLIRIWRANADSPTILEPEKRSIWIQFLPDSARIASASADGTVTLWNVAKARRVSCIELRDRSGSPCLRYAADSNFTILGVLLCSGDILFRDTKTWNIRWPYHNTVEPLVSSFHDD